MASNLHLYLTDAEMGINQDLQLHPVYSISLKKGIYESRFSLRCIPLNIPGKLNNEEDIYQIYESGANLFLKIKLVHEQSGILMISNIMGQMISKTAINGNGDYELENLIPSVIYVVSFRTPGGVHSKKILKIGN
jgi:hypothetical protein